ncbi:hypothetical protein I4F81_012079 [Pyropia yezoensis]|uniref:Uncharacterized protein n=1 Tax=Pyropia yezoensis TaxID=2788 RepID=A0ACC3CHW9_PYRYE|nr:hypothetical protein I4F81_012079 [Neopyropia yezoensis]
MRSTVGRSLPLPGQPTGNGASGAAGVAAFSAGHGTILDAVLPPGSLVRISGNNRTKLQLIGKVGRVVSSQTLGGWHEVSLEAAGGVVRVQRNALEVLSLAPAVPGASVHGHPSGGGRSSGGSHRASTLGASARGSTSAAAAARALGEASYDSLKRYRAAYGLNVDVDCSRDELVRAVRRHFASSSVDELQVISDFLRRVRHCSSPAL